MKAAAVSFVENITQGDPRTIFPVFEDDDQNTLLSGVKQKTDFTGKLGQLQAITHPFESQQVYVLGLGKRADFDEVAARKAGKAICESLPKDKPQNLTINGSHIAGDADKTAAQL